MNYFSHKLSINIGIMAASISFFISIFTNFKNIYDFHGSWIEFLIYILEGLAQSGINSLTVFLICAIFAFPLLRIIEYKKNKNEKK